ncbi:MAG TPA: hypothetical protein VD902_00185 [Symbiobacteriaceae bacterium]|nr:hypothetical protein [Symbiobacteriaceae bacterium]
MAIAIPTLVLIGLALLLPNYLAVRYAMLGGTPVSAAAGGTASASTGTVIRFVRRSGGRSIVERGYLWKALSPLLFAASIILALGLGGWLGGAIVLLAFLNLLFGMLGWDAYIPGKK